MGPPKDAPFVMTKEMSFGKLQMTTFFDLKEDGSLDILVEYTEVDTRRLKFDFIHCDDKGDTTFLKVQVFTNVCTKNCKNSKATELGSGISWHGSCAYYTMADTSGNIQKGLQCQLPQTSQRALYVPSILFGLGRSPNFIDEVSIGSPRPSDDTSNQHFVLYQIVPNSRLIVVPPEGNEIHWNSRLYLTPNQLIIQSIVALASLCILLTILILLLHYHEHRQDVREKQAQLHRFHFDAM
uniref:T-cell immunomodulatory protein n=1 Tax=Panagrolaimus sp. JU765 TaxID=591449 RepID=A0AC34QJA5_9BILA